MAGCAIRSSFAGHIGRSAKAKKEGRYKGRAPTARAKATDVLALKQRGFKPHEIAKQVEISRASVYQILASQQA